MASRFNSRIGDQLVAGALECLRRHGVEPGDVQLVRVPRAGHSSTVEEPAAVTAALQSFLEAL